VPVFFVEQDDYFDPMSSTGTKGRTTRTTASGSSSSAGRPRIHRMLSWRWTWYIARLADGAHSALLQIEYAHAQGTSTLPR